MIITKRVTTTTTETVTIRFENGEVITVDGDKKEKDVEAAEALINALSNLNTKKTDD